MQQGPDSHSLNVIFEMLDIDWFSLKALFFFNTEHTIDHNNQ